jgi:hypothetical protein
VSPERALALVRQRDQLVTLVLENERDQAQVPPFDWPGWRQSRGEIVGGFRAEREGLALAQRKLRALARLSPHRSVDNPVDEP